MNASASSLVVGFLIGVTAASAGFAALGRVSAGGSPGTSARVLRVAHALPTSHPVHEGIVFMAKRAGELSGGRLRLDVFPSEQLGNETQCLEQTQAGTLAITKVSAGVIGNFVSNYKVFSLPYLFRDSAHMWSVLAGPVGQELLTSLAVGNDGSPSGLIGLTFYDSGSRSFYASKPILSPADLRGMKIRTMADTVAMDTMAAMGAAPTPIPWGELYTSLQQGVVDGAENNAPSLYTSRHYEVSRHYTLDHHSRIPDVLVMSSRVWDSLSEDERGWIRRAAEESMPVQREVWDRENERAMTELRAAGVTVHEVDPEPFRQAVAPVMEKYAQGSIGNLVRQIEAVE
jgi:tripartite ATP-independent transporter DctP family solute receptor